MKPKLVILARKISYMFGFHLYFTIIYQDRLVVLNENTYGDLLYEHGKRRIRSHKYPAIYHNGEDDSWDLYIRGSSKSADKCVMMVVMDCGIKHKRNFLNELKEVVRLFNSECVEGVSIDKTTDVELLI